jgi:hypothetical protein
MAGLVRRLAVLGGVALLAALVVLAVQHRRESHTTSSAPQPILAPGGGWYHAVATVSGGRVGRRTSCGIVMRAGTLGVADPVLPCGAKIFLLFGGTRALTQVIDRTPAAAAYRFELTPALGRRIGLSGVQPVQWAFASPPQNARVAAVLDPVRGAAFPVRTNTK